MTPPKPLSPEAEKIQEAMRSIIKRAVVASAIFPRVDTIFLLEEAARLFDSHQSARTSALEAALQKCSDHASALIQRSQNEYWTSAGWRASMATLIRVCERVLRGESNG